MPTKTTKRNRSGRPIKLTITLTKKICLYLAKGNYFGVACTVCGITPKTAYNWRAKGEKEKSGIYRDFLSAVEFAEALAETESLDAIRNRLNGWQAAAWMLERRHRERWGKSMVEVTGKDGGPIEIDAKDKLLSLLGGIAAREGPVSPDPEAEPSGS